MSEIEIQIPTDKATYWEQYLGLWAIREQDLMVLSELVRGIDITAHINSSASEEARQRAANYGYELTSDGVAVLSLTGVLMKQVSSLSNNTSTAKARRAIRAAMNDPAAKSIVLRIDSPGGTVAGTKELADDVAEAAKKKPVYSYIEDLGASAAYWIASQAGEISANPTALAGSIGTYQVVYDLSGMAAKEGIKVHVVKAGDFKGVGVQGTEITPTHLAEIQRTINAMNSFFTEAVGSGRKMTPEQVATLADGRVHIASEAKRLGLIDQVESWDSFIQRVSQAKVKPNGLTARGAGPVGDFKASEQVEKTMSQQAEGPKPATIAEIKAACEGASPEFVLAQVEAGATVEAAIKAHNKVLAERLASAEASAKAAREEAEKAKAEAAAKAPKLTGAKPVSVTDEGTTGGSARAEWLQKIEAKKALGYDNAKACITVNRENPGLRQRMLAEQNG